MYSAVACRYSARRIVLVYSLLLSPDVALVSLVGHVPMHGAPLNYF